MGPDLRFTIRLYESLVAPIIGPWIPISGLFRIINEGFTLSSISVILYIRIASLMRGESMLNVQFILAHGGALHREMTRWDKTGLNRPSQNGRSFEYPTAHVSARLDTPNYSLILPLRSSNEKLSLLSGFDPICG